MHGCDHDLGSHGGFYCDNRYKVRKKLQKSMQSVAHMQEQVQHAMDWLCQAYGISMDDAMRCALAPSRLRIYSCQHQPLGLHKLHTALAGSTQCISHPSHVVGCTIAEMTLRHDFMIQYLRQVSA